MDALSRRIESGAQVLTSQHGEFRRVRASEDALIGSVPRVLLPTLCGPSFPP
jgi:hypothetical protein